MTPQLAGIGAYPERSSSAVVDAIVSLDPSGAGTSGCAVRFTAGLRPAKEYVAGRSIPAPDWVWEGDVWDPSFQDEISKVLAKRFRTRRIVEPKVVLVTESTAYRSLTIAWSLGTAVGCVRGLLTHLGVLGSFERIPVWTWRRRVFGKGATFVGREAWKEAAVLEVGKRYGLVVGSDAAEAILINDGQVLGT